MLTPRAVQSSSEGAINARQSSVDGDTNTCFTTLTETNPWWLVDLGQEYIVDGVTLATSINQTGVCIYIRISVIVYMNI